jgi:hypothetical protein
MISAVFVFQFDLSLEGGCTGADAKTYLATGENVFIILDHSGCNLIVKFLFCSWSSFASVEQCFLFCSWSSFASVEQCGVVQLSTF